MKLVAVLRRLNNPCKICYLIMNDDLSDMSTVEHFEYSLGSTFASELSNNSSVENCDNFDYITKGLHLCNLIFPNIDEIRLSLSNTNSPDIFGICESFYNRTMQIVIVSFLLMSSTLFGKIAVDGSGLVLYFKEALNLKRRYDLESSNIETLWADVILPNSKPVLICPVYRPPDARSGWIDLFEKAVSTAQTTGHEFLLMGGFNIDMATCSNNKWFSLKWLKSQLGSQKVLHPI